MALPLTQFNLILHFLTILYLFGSFSHKGTYLAILFILLQVLATSRIMINCNTSSTAAMTEESHIDGLDLIPCK